MVVPLERRKGEGQEEPKDAEMASLVSSDAKDKDKDKDAMGDSTKYREGMGKVIMAIGMYTSCSVAMVMANKSLASR
jgi:hypothetical protein